MGVVEWARAAVERELEALPRRLAHSAGVARQASLLAEMDPFSLDGHVLVAAAHLHDIGYGPGIRRTGFHPLDGAMYLREAGHVRLSSLVAYHSGARSEAEFRGLGRDLAVYEPEISVVADALTYCDMTTGADGEVVTLSQRLADIEARHGSESLVVRALRASQPELERAVVATQELLGVTADAS